MKEGYKTTEFWVTIAANVGAIAAAGSAVLPPKWAALVSAFSVFSYNVSRGLAKHKVPNV